MLEIKNLTAKIADEDTQILNGLNLTVETGQVAAIMGPNGSGKSTLIRTINRLEPIDDGQIYVDGQDVRGNGVDINKLRSRIGFVFQS
ncbi:ATP-binding cassette domain-containing protein, partial [Acinetobacter baumannii]